MGLINNHGIFERHSLILVIGALVAVLAVALGVAVVAAGILALGDPALAERLDAWRAALSDSIPEVPVDE